MNREFEPGSLSVTPGPGNFQVTLAMEPGWPSMGPTLYITLDNEAIIRLTEEMQRAL